MKKENQKKNTQIKQLMKRKTNSNYSFVSFLIFHVIYIIMFLGFCGGREGAVCVRRRVSMRRLGTHQSWVRIRGHIYIYIVYILQGIYKVGTDNASIQALHQYEINSIFSRLYRGQVQLTPVRNETEWNNSLNACQCPNRVHTRCIQSMVDKCYKIEEEENVVKIVVAKRQQNCAPNSSKSS